ncbi:MAG: formylglycine-generating enzyme family protein, partial [Nitrospiria bacterium]
AIEYVTWKRKKTGLSYCLPTEAQWEYAAKSGGKSEKMAGTSSESELGAYAWYKGNAGGKTHPVGQKRPNGLGLYDMSGNVWEWLRDWYGEDYYDHSARDNPKGPSSGKGKVIRGGSWYVIPRSVRTAYRNWSIPDKRHYNSFGFRLSLCIE